MAGKTFDEDDDGNDTTTVERQEPAQQVAGEVLVDDDGNELTPAQLQELQVAQHGSAAVDEDDDDEDAPARKEAQSDDPEREAIRERRRQERQAKRQKEREERERLQAEINAQRTQNAQLADRLAALERSNVSAELAQLDVAISNAQHQVALQEGIIAEASRQNNGQLVAEATRKMLEAQQAAQNLSRLKQARTMQASQPAAPALDPMVVSFATKFMNENRWYNPQSGDTDSRIMLALDDALAREGFMPNTPQYWDELKKRAKRYLPHRFSGAQANGTETGDNPPPKPKGMRGGGNVGTNGGGTAPKGFYRLSAERVQAIKDAGMWDDLELRKKMIAQFRDYDRRNGNK